MEKEILLCIASFIGALGGALVANRYYGSKRDPESADILSPPPLKRSGPLLIRREKEKRKIRFNDDKAAARAEREER
jgi:hypothetical protein